MPVGISDVQLLTDEVRNDLRSEDFQPDERDRIKKAIGGIKNRCGLSTRDPRTHHEYTKLGEWNDWAFYRKWVGKDFARLIFAVKGEKMVLVAVIRKDDDAYDTGDYRRRMQRNQR